MSPEDHMHMYLQSGEAEQLWRSLLDALFGFNEWFVHQVVNHGTRSAAADKVWATDDFREEGIACNWLQATLQERYTKLKQAVEHVGTVVVSMARVRKAYIGRDRESTIKSICQPYISRNEHAGSSDQAEHRAETSAIMRAVEDLTNEKDLRKVAAIIWAIADSHPASLPEVEDLKFIAEVLGRPRPSLQVAHSLAHMTPRQASRYFGHVVAHRTSW